MMMKIFILREEEKSQSMQEVFLLKKKHSSTARLRSVRESTKLAAFE